MYNFDYRFDTQLYNTRGHYHGLWEQALQDTSSAFVEHDFNQYLTES